VANSSTEATLYNALGQRIQISGGVNGTVLDAYDEAGHLLGEGQRRFDAAAPSRTCIACAAAATAASGPWVVELSAMNAAMARAEMNRRRPIGTLANAPLLNKSYKVLRAMPPNNTCACSIEYNTRSMRDLPSRGF